MLILSWIKFGLLLVCCTRAAWTDWKLGKIGNRLIVMFLIIAAVLDGISYGILNQETAVLFLKNAGILIGLSLLLYFTKIFAGGDTKLMILVSLLYPAEWYPEIEQQDFALCYLLALMFAAGFIYIFAESLVLMISGKQKINGKQLGRNILMAFVQYLRMLIYMAAFSHPYLYLVAPRIQLPEALYSLLCILFAWWIGTREIASSKVLLFAVLAFDAVMAILTRTVVVSTFWPTYLVVAIFMILRVFLNFFNYETVAAKDVTKGMILSRMSSIVMQQSRVKGLPGISDETLNSRLTEEEAQSVRRWANSKYGKKNLTIVRKMPFAVFILSGVILYFVLGRVW